MCYFQCAILVLLAVNGFCLRTEENVCFSEERYVEVEQIKTTQPVQVRSYNWCLSYPPRCTNYRTEIKEVFKLQNSTKTRTVSFCCPGYVEVKNAENETLRAMAPGQKQNNNNQTVDESLVCKPMCRGGCGKGICQTPNNCKCDVGYEGQHCNQRCRYGMWGDNCKSHCKCRNGSLCDSKSGFCRCTEGWIGKFCEIPCPMGYHGVMCKSVCKCASRQCNHVNGECSFDDSYILFDWDGSSGRNTSTSQNAQPTERIKAKHWIQIKGNGRMLMKNCTDDPSDACDWNKQENISKLNLGENVDNRESPSTVHDRNEIKGLVGETDRSQGGNNTIIVNTLQSSIANLTDNIGKLSKQVNDQRIELSRDREHKDNVSHQPNNISNSVSLSMPNAHNSELIPPADAAEVEWDVDSHNGGTKTADSQSGLQLIKGRKFEKIIAISQSDADREGAVIELDAAGSDPEPSIVIRSKSESGIEKRDESQISGDTDRPNEEVLHIITGLPTTQSNTNTTKIEIHQHDTGPQISIILILILFTLIAFAVILLFYMLLKRTDQGALSERQVISNQQEPELIAISNIEQKPLPGIPSFIAIANPPQCQVTASDLNVNGISVGATAATNQQHTQHNGKTDFSERRRSNIEEHIYDEICYPAWDGQQKIQ